MKHSKIKSEKNKKQDKIEKKRINIITDKIRHAYRTHRCKAKCPEGFVCAYHAYNENDRKLHQNRHERSLWSGIKTKARFHEIPYSVLTQITNQIISETITHLVIEPVTRRPLLIRNQLSNKSDDNSVDLNAAARSLETTQQLDDNEQKPEEYVDIEWLDENFDTTDLIIEEGSNINLFNIQFFSFVSLIN